MTMIMAGVGIYYITDRWIRGFMIYFAIWQGSLWVASLISVKCIALAHNSMEMFTQTTILSLLWIYVSRLKKDVIDENSIFNVICVAALIQTVIGWFQVFGISLYDYVLSPFVIVKSEMAAAVTGMLQNNNFLAGFMAISAIFFFRKKWLFGLIPIIPLFYFMNTRTAVISLCAGIAVKYRIYWKIFVPVMAVIAILFMVFTRGIPLPFSGIAGDRYDIWLKVLAFMFSDWTRLLCGNSPGLVMSGNIHNEYLTIFMKFGFVGLTFMAGYIWNLPRDHKILYPAMIVALVNMIGNFPMELPVTMALITIIAGMLERCRK